MINRLHNLANTILGIEDLKQTDDLFRLVVVNSRDYTIKLFSGELIVSPIKINRNGTLEYLLPAGVFYLRVYIKNDDNTYTQDYFEEIYISTDMYGMLKTIKL